MGQGVSRSGFQFRWSSGSGDGAGGWEFSGSRCWSSTWSSEAWSLGGWGRLREACWACWYLRVFGQFAHAGAFVRAGAPSVPDSSEKPVVHSVLSSVRPYCSFALSFVRPSMHRSACAWGLSGTVGVMLCRNQTVTELPAPALFEVHWDVQPKLKSAERTSAREAASAMTTLNPDRWQSLRRMLELKTSPPGTE